MSKELSHVSPRKVAANRQNALKSTGPKTPRGKAYSSRNALQHGLFAIDQTINWFLHFEDPDKYQALLQDLAESYQPVGGAEELEVQQIAASWWRRSRAWRYENAEIVRPLCTSLTAINQMKKEGRARLVLLNNAASEIEASGKVSDELKRKMFADAGIQNLWESAQEILNKPLAEAIESTPKGFLEADPDTIVEFVLGETGRGTYVFVPDEASLCELHAKLACDLEAIPQADVLDRVLRADAAAERSLNHATDRLERLQRRRLGDAVPPPVTVRLTR